MATVGVPDTVTAAQSERPLRKVVWASLVGTTIEWYDFFLYGTAAALVFNRQFFPQADPLTGAMLAFTTWALGFLARPLGGVVFGHFGDRIGRKQLLMASLVLMGVATVLIGCLPTYAQVGPLAPALTRMRASSVSNSISVRPVSFRSLASLRINASSMSNLLMLSLSC